MEPSSNGGRMPGNRASIYLIVLLAAVAVYCGTMISPPSLMDDVDAVQAQIARNMLRSGDWVTARLDGIDLSPAMIEKARARGIYDWLAVADIEVAPALAEGRYDLVLAADTLVYLGDLAATMQGVARALKADGFFLFTVEKKEGEGFELGPKRRWRHSEMYMRELAEAHELEIAGLLACTPRMEGGTPVEGLAMALRKPV